MSTLQLHLVTIAEGDQFEQIQIYIFYRQSIIIQNHYPFQLNVMYEEKGKQMELLLELLSEFFYFSFDHLYKNHD